MARPRPLSVIVLANAFGGLLSCRGSLQPPPCSWTVCRLELREDWVPDISTGQCVNKQRRVHHTNTQHHGSRSYPAPVPCNPVQIQRRLMCKSDSRSVPSAQGVTVNSNRQRIYKKHLFRLTNFMALYFYFAFQ